METNLGFLEGIDIEEMQSLFFDDKALVEPSYKLYQLNQKGHRYYYLYNEDGEVEFFPSVTTILSQTMPTSPYLVKWIADMGYEASEAYKNEKAAYGTFMHAQFEEFLIAKTYNLDSVSSRMQLYIEQEHLAPNFIKYVDDIKKDILSFAQFVKDYDVRPLAVEIALVHPEHHYAGMIDLPCTMLAKPGSEERINCIIDFKSGKKGFYEDYEIQLGMYRDMWNINFPAVPIEHIFNFAPKDWRKKPTYTLKEQTDSPNLAKIPALLELASIEDAKINTTITTITGTITIGSNDDLTDYITTMELSDIIKGNNGKNANNEEQNEE